MSDITLCGRIAPSPPCSLPLAGMGIRAGFPSPADDYLDSSIDLNGYLMSDPDACFVVRVQGDSMSGVGIMEGDLLIVDKGRPALHGDIVVAVVDGDFTVKRLHRRHGRLALLPENPAYPVLVPQSEQELLIWGVVCGCVRRY